MAVDVLSKNIIIHLLLSLLGSSYVDIKFINLEMLHFCGVIGIP